MANSNIKKSEHPIVTCITTCISVLTYTVLIITSTWAVTKFIIKDKDQESIKLENEYLKDKIGILSDEKKSLKEKNETYLKWLIETPNTIPFYENRIQILNDKIEMSKSTEQIINSKNIKQKDYYYFKSVSVGDAFFDNETQVSFGINEIKFNPLSVSGILNLPKESIEILNATVSTRWDFTYNEKQYFISIDSISYYSDSCTISIRSKNDNS